MGESSFKERVRKILIDEALNYQRNYVDYEYLIWIKGSKQKFYILSGMERNFIHLTGVHTNLDKKIFYEKCIAGDLKITDFSLVDEDGKDIKGTVRRKITVLNNMNCLMQKKELYVQDKFVKNRVVCTIGASDCACTVGFIQSSKQKMARAFPKTLLKGNELKDTQKVELLLRRKKGNKKFDEILIGNREIIRGNFEELKEIVAVDLYIKKEENRMSKFYKHKMVYFKIKVPICFNPNAYVKRVIKCKLAYRSKRTYYE